MTALGAMTMPASFAYKSVYLRGKPTHEPVDAFRIKHPPMGAARWAKIFAPFDALEGFDEMIASAEKHHIASAEKDPAASSEEDPVISA